MPEPPIVEGEEESVTDKRMRIMAGVRAAEGKLNRPITDKELELVLQRIRTLLDRTMFPGRVEYRTLLRSTHLSAGVVKAALEELEKLGFVVKEKAGRKTLYRYVPSDMDLKSEPPAEVPK